MEHSFLFEHLFRGPFWAAASSMPSGPKSEVLAADGQETHRFGADLEVDEADAVEYRVEGAPCLHFRRLVEHDVDQPGLQPAARVVGELVTDPHDAAAAAPLQHGCYAGIGGTGIVDADHVGVGVQGILE